ncbi:MAG: wax ester/triacylglycerol synthase family O-acyltransferase [Xanthomonadales bacterium]|nr:wax ester/triacylglycerol synthase family O-acyltransferase [Xanthomonadales bacterium]
MLKQLSGLDTMFLYMESSRTPLEVGSLQIYDPSTAPGGRVRFKELLALFDNRLDCAPIFKSRLLEVPLSLDHPYWMKDDEFDIEYHLRHISLPRPGDWRQLMIQIARLQSQQLDKSRPLWEVYVIEGLNNVAGVRKGCFALFTKMHHAIVDGVGSLEIQRRIHDLEPLKPDLPSSAPPPRRSKVPEPSPWRLLARSPFSCAVKSTRLARALACAAPGLLRAALASGGSERPSAPRTIFNVGRASANRVIDGRFFQLAEIREIAKQVPGTKVNDVVLAVVGGAMRCYLQSKSRLPSRTLVAGCPIDIRQGDIGHAAHANMVSMMNAPLRTDLADPLERLRAVFRGTLEAKAMTREIGAARLTALPMNLPAPIAKNLYPPLMDLLGRSGRLAFNTVVTNVPGPTQPIYLAGARMVKMIGMGPVLDQAGIFHAAFSYDGMLSISFTACREMLPDPGFYAECIQQAFEELRDAAFAPPLRSGSGRKKKKRRSKAARTRKAETSLPAVATAPAAENDTDVRLLKKKARRKKPGTKTSVKKSPMKKAKKQVGAARRKVGKKALRKKGQEKAVQQPPADSSARKAGSGN